MAHLKSKILLLPGLWNSGEQHWQSHWEKTYGFERVLQDDWETPICDNWIATIDKAVMQNDLNNVILVGHSLACATVGFWAKKYRRVIKGALLVAPSDTESPIYPNCTTGFQPMPTWKLPFKSIVVASTNDEYVSTKRAKFFANIWGSDYYEVGDLGHINSAANLELWEKGFSILKTLD